AHPAQGAAARHRRTAHRARSRRGVRLGRHGHRPAPRPSPGHRDTGGDPGGSGGAVGVPRDGRDGRTLRGGVTMALLEVRGLTAGYAGSAVLHGVDLTVGAAEVVAVLGRNGVGKSTLVNTVDRKSTRLN